MKLAQFTERHPYGFVAIMEAMVVLVYLLDRHWSDSWFHDLRDTPDAATLPKDV